MKLKEKDEKRRNYVISLFKEYLLREHRSDLIHIATHPPHVHAALVVHFNCLCEFSSVFSELLLTKPQGTIQLLDEGLVSALDTDIGDKAIPARIPNVHVRLTALPVIPEVHRTTIPYSSDVGKFIALRGTVSRVGPVQVLEGRTAYVCSKCGYRLFVDADFENAFIPKIPRRCPNPESPCNSTSFAPLSKGVFYAKNYQEIRVHEPFRSLSVGVMPRSIRVCLEDDLLECVKPGDDVVINGIVMRQWHLPKLGAPCDISLWIKANFVENLSELRAGVTSSRLPSDRIHDFETFWSRYSTFEQALEGRNILIRSICPEVCGMYLIKLSLALILAGTPEQSSSAPDQIAAPTDLRPRTRGSPHLLLIGDPGTAKSVLLRAATNLSNRGVLTAATGTTAAGLTASAIRGPDGWSLDAGALVLADGGLCAIDEFTSLHGAHRSSVHEAMEQQTISLAKAGLVTRLNCRCSVLAAANPTSGFDLQMGDIGLPTSLLSRFDLVWRLVDPLNSNSWDRKVADFVLKLSVKQNTHPTRKLWSADRLREYFVWVRQEFKPQLTKPAANLLRNYYVWRRGTMNTCGPYADSTEQGRTTLRLLESLVRLTKAHARLMARSVAGVEDAVVVVALMDASLQSTTPHAAGPGVTGCSAYMTTPEAIVACDIPADAASEYRKWEPAILRSLSEVKASDEVINLNEPLPEQQEDLSPEEENEAERPDDEGENEISPTAHGFLSDETDPHLSAAPLFTSTQLKSQPSPEQHVARTRERLSAFAFRKRPLTSNGKFPNDGSPPPSSSIKHSKCIESSNDVCCLPNTPSEPCPTLSSDGISHGNFDAVSFCKSPNPNARLSPLSFLPIYRQLTDADFEIDL
ncbi:unnamed protein product [Dicrocoelium dendriticum]|nr:unnamed protein product [Dicrocoelium dendriticum]